MAGRLGLARAVDYALELGLEAIGRRVSALPAKLREALAQTSGVIVRDRGALLSGIVTIERTGEEPAALAARLRRRGVNISVTETLRAARLRAAPDKLCRPRVSEQPIPEITDWRNAGSDHALIFADFDLA